MEFSQKSKFWASKIAKIVDFEPLKLPNLISRKFFRFSQCVPIMYLMKPFLRKNHMFRQIEIVQMGISLFFNRLTDNIWSKVSVTSLKRDMGMIEHSAWYLCLEFVNKSCAWQNWTLGNIGCTIHILLASKMFSWNCTLLLLEF